MQVVVTTTLGAGPDAKEEALLLAAELSTSYVPRDCKRLEDLLDNYGVEGLLVVGARRVSLFCKRPEDEGNFKAGTKELNRPESNRVFQEFFFHPGTAKIRIKSILSGKPDQMIQAMDLRPGDAVLDCTLGLGADALVASFVVGAKGRVVGLEKVAPIAAIVERGLAKYSSPSQPLLNEAMRRIKVEPIEHLEYLHRAPSESFDVVYFDPFFRVTVKGADQMRPLRTVGDVGPLSLEAVQEACRVARRRVVMKERRESREFARLGFNRIAGGRYARVAFGVIEK